MHKNSLNQVILMAKTIKLILFLYLFLLSLLTFIVLLIDKMLKKIVAPTRNWTLLFLQTENFNLNNINWNLLFSVWFSR